MTLTIYMCKLEVYMWRTYSSQNVWAVFRNELPTEVGNKVMYLLIYSDVNIRLNNAPNFVFCWPRVSIHPCNEIQLDALFILSLFRQSTSTCFGHICSQSSGGILYIHNNLYVLCFPVECMLAGRPTYSQLENITLITIVVYIQYTSWWWATDMLETCRGWLTK